MTQIAEPYIWNPRLPILAWPPLLTGRLLERQKRFLSTVLLDDGRTVTAHCPNPGRMTSILPQPERVYLSDLGPATSTRKLQFRWELAQTEEALVLVNTQLANQIAARLLDHQGAMRGKLRLEGELRREVSRTFSDGSTSRFDFQVGDPTSSGALLEVKQVSLRTPDHQGLAWAAFPDAVTQRGARHLKHLQERKRLGERTVLAYLVGRSDVDGVKVAKEIDPSYARAFTEAMKSGVEALGVRLRVTPVGVFFDDWLEVVP